MATPLGESTWTDHWEVERRPLLVVPVGSCEQHGPHLPLDTDTRIAVALSERLVETRRRILAPDQTTVLSKSEVKFQMKDPNLSATTVTYFGNVQFANPGTAGTDSVQTYVGRESDWRVASPGGSTQTGLSSTYLTAVQTTSGQFQITGFSHSISDSLTDAYVTATVRINEHQYKASVNTVS